MELPEIMKRIDNIKGIKANLDQIDGIIKIFRTSVAKKQFFHLIRKTKIKMLIKPGLRGSLGKKVFKFLTGSYG